MKRRKFLGLAGLGTAAIAVPAFAINSDAFCSRAIGSVITKKLSYLKLEQAGVQTFASDILAYHRKFSFKHSLKVRTMLCSEYLFPGSTSKMMIDDFVSDYLLATDFFFNKMDESKEVKYVGLHDAYKRPCSNPFSHIVFTPEYISSRKEKLLV